LLKKTAQKMLKFLLKAGFASFSQGN